MTKEEVRAITLGKAAVSAGDIVWDVGAGTGSLTVEAALLAPRGQVYAVEKSETALMVLKQNIKEFKVQNVEVVPGEAPDALRQLPNPNIVFVGGSGGRLDKIIGVIAKKLEPKGRVVLNAITLNTVTTAIEKLKASNFQVDITLAAITKLEPLKDNFIYKAHNPVHIISAVKEEEN